MHTDLRARRKLCIIAYRQFLEADRAWIKALDEAATLMPDVMGHGYWRLGNRGSRIRGYYERRDRALQKMMAAHAKLNEARRRLQQPGRTHHNLRLLVAEVH